MKHPIHILLVEDDPADAELTIRELKKNPLAAHISHVRDGEAALHFLFEGKEPINLILLDIKMPKIGGIDVLEKIKSNERTRSIPVVMLTSSEEELDIRTCYKLGVNSFIVKPMQFQDFTNTIRNLGLYWLSMNQN